MGNHPLEIWKELTCPSRRFVNPVQLSTIEYDTSTKFTGLLQSLFLSQLGVYLDEDHSTQLSLRSAFKHSKSKAIVSTKDALIEESPPHLRKALEVTSEKAVFNWLMHCITCKNMDFHFKRQLFMM